MHAEAYAFVRSIVELTHRPRAAVEFGAYDVNGNCRSLFPSVTRWHGIDVRPGPNVDEVANAETWRTKARYDLVLCTEVLEHARHPDLIVGSAFRALRKKGKFVMTCAGNGREPHTDDGVHGVPIPHYRNIPESEMDEWLRDAGFRVKRLEVNRSACDLYVLALRP